MPEPNGPAFEPVDKLLLPTPDPETYLGTIELTLVVEDGPGTLLPDFSMLDSEAIPLPAEGCYETIQDALTA